MIGAGIVLEKPKPSSYVVIRVRVLPPTPIFRVNRHPLEDGRYSPPHWEVDRFSCHEGEMSDPHPFIQCYFSLLVIPAALFVIVTRSFPELRKWAIGILASLFFYWFR